MFTYTATLSTKGQLVIPAKVRKLLGLEPGDSVTLIPDSHAKKVTLMVKTSVKDAIKEGYGLLKDPNNPNAFKELMKMRKEERELEEAKLNRFK